MADSSPKLMDYDAAQKLVSKYGIKPIRSQYVKSADESVKFAAGKPIVLKGLTNKALHKSKSGLIALNLYSEKMVRDSFLELSKRLAKLKPYRILVQHMVQNGREIIIGGSTDPQFGKMVLVGLGGIYVEAFRDFAMRVCPITREDARSMVQQLKSKSVVVPDEKSEKLLEELLMKTSKMFMASKASEIDLNPVILHSEGYDAVDIRILV
jgi:succinyl-CoA synthetase beta subunit